EPEPAAPDEPPQFGLLAQTVAHMPPHWQLTMASKAVTPEGLARWQLPTHVWFEQASAHAGYRAHGEVDGAQATLSSTQALPGPTEASAQSAHESFGGAALMTACTKEVKTGETRTLAPSFVQSGSPNDVTPATRSPAGVLTRAGPPESP